MELLANSHVPTCSQKHGIGFLFKKNKKQTSDTSDLNLDGDFKHNIPYLRDML